MHCLEKTDFDSCNHTKKNSDRLSKLFEDQNLMVRGVIGYVLTEMI